MTFALHGIAVSKGIAIGKAVLISRAALEVSHYLVEVGKEEVEAQKLLDAFEQVRRNWSSCVKVYLKTRHKKWLRS